MSESQRQNYTPKEKEEVFDQEFLPHINSMYNSSENVTIYYEPFFLVITQ